jgi:hypothetical protein
VRESFTPDELASIIERVRAEHAVTLSSLRLNKLSSKAQGELLNAIARAGLEHTGKAIRKPLREQLRELITRAGASGVASSAVARELKGARSSKELQMAVAELILDGQLALVADARASRLTSPGPALLSEEELSALAGLAEGLAKLVKLARAAKGKPRPTLSRAALEEPLQVLQKLAAKQETARVRSAVHAALASAPLHAGLVRVPDLIRGLESQHSRPSLLAALEAFACEGQLELRPDSAIGRLPDDDRARCPAGPDGTPLVYARPLPAARRELV